jgi:mannose-6-phosphate isomerase-like protein (cupin superfamily)
VADPGGSIRVYYVDRAHESPVVRLSFHRDRGLIIQGERRMSRQRLATVLLVTGIALGGTLAPAQTPAPEQPLARGAQDARLEWGACPPFMPPGCGLAVLHGDPAKPNSDVFLRLPAGSAIAEHWHTSAERMILVSGRLSVRYKGQSEVVLEPGMYAYGPARLPHSASCAAGEPCVLFIAFESAVDAVPVATPAK